MRDIYRETTFDVVKVHFHFNIFAVGTYELCHIFSNVNNGEEREREKKSCLMTDVIVSLKQTNQHV